MIVGQGLQRWSDGQGSLEIYCLWNVDDIGLGMELPGTTELGSRTHLAYRTSFTFSFTYSVQCLHLSPPLWDVLCDVTVPVFNAQCCYLAYPEAGARNFRCIFRSTLCQVAMSRRSL